MAVTTEPQEMEAFYEEIEAKGYDALWRNRVRGDPTYPPRHWRWVDVEQFAMRSRELVKPGPTAERRVILLKHPQAGPGGATHTLTAAVQTVMPGEIAPSHRHTAAAIRWILQGKATVTMVNGEPCPMAPGDLVLTPGWTWHGHINQSDGPMIWMDSLDVPLVSALRAMKQEPYPDELNPATKAIGDSAARYGTGYLKPVWEENESPISPLLVYPWAKTEQALHDLAKFDASPYDDVAFQYTNPTTGGHVLPTIGCWIQMLRPGAHTKAHRHTTSQVYQCFRGHGSLIVNGLSIDWEEGDFIALPPWSWHEHVNRSESEDAILFSTTDAPVLHSLNLYWEEPYEENGGRQAVKGNYADTFGYDNLN